jgi:magnesium-transporting ATPase (P-type)
LDVGGEGYGPDGDFRKDDSSIAGVDLGNSDYRIFFYAAVLCNNASLIPPNAENSNWHISGDSTEGALLALVEKAGIDVGTIRSTYPVLRRFPFDSVRKRMSTVHDLGTNRDGGEKHYVLVKGAPRELLGLSTKALIDGKELPIDKKFEQEIDRQIDRFAQEGMRVLGFAYRRLAEKQLVEASVDQIEQGLIFTGLTAVLDPPREDVGEAVRTCRKAGVRVIMITGEYQLTALSVARKLGIVERADARVMSGKELSEITDEELRSALEAEEIVFARVNPEHRLRVVGALKNMGKSVAVTGDGISDAPVLKLADIGVAMGRRGNSVTRATAEMVLATDSFSGIVAAIGEGRILFTNLRKTVEHISSHLLPEATAFVVFLLFGGPLPLAVPLIFLIDLLIDLVPAFAVGTALSATEESMSRPVHRRDRHIVDGTTVGHNFIFRGFLVTLVAGAGFIVTSNDPGSAYPTSPFASPTVFFLAIIAAQLAFYVSRFAGVGAPRVEGFGHWATLLSAALCPMVVVVLVLYVPTLNAVFRTAPPVGHDWIVVAAVFAIIYGIAEIQGLVGRSRERSQGDPAEA